MPKTKKILIVLICVIVLIIFIRLTIYFSDEKTALKQEMLSSFTKEDIATASIIDVYLESPDKYSAYIESLTKEEFLLHTKYTIIIDRLNNAPCSWLFVIFLTLSVCGICTSGAIAFSLIGL